MLRQKRTFENMSYTNLNPHKRQRSNNFQPNFSMVNYNNQYANPTIGNINNDLHDKLHHFEIMFNQMMQSMKIFNDQIEILHNKVNNLQETIDKKEKDEKIKEDFFYSYIS